MKQKHQKEGNEFTIVFGGYLAVLATDIKQIIAYSTTSQLG